MPKDDGDMYRPRDDDDLSEPPGVGDSAHTGASSIEMFYQETKGSLQQPNEFLSN